MGPVEAIKRLITSGARNAQLAAEIRDGIANLTDVVDRRMAALIAEQDNQSQLINQRLSEFKAAGNNESAGSGGVMPAEGLRRFGVPQALSIPYVEANGAEGADLVASIVESPQHREAASFFATQPFWADRIITEYGISLIYALVRNLRPDVVVEIGSFKGKTAYAIAHALVQNGTGQLHTIGPFDADEFLPRYAQWPDALRARVAFHPVNSADFFMSNERAGRRFDLSFVDGNHDYEFALFDILCAARRTKPGGLILVDNVSQAGPYFAALDFLAANQEWREIGTQPLVLGSTLAFDRERASVPNTDFLILQAPRKYRLTSRPTTFGEIAWNRNVIEGACVEIEGDGEVVCQCVLRSFGRNGQTETIASGRGSGEIRFTSPAVAPENDDYRVELWLSSVDGDLKISKQPRPL